MPGKIARVVLACVVVIALSWPARRAAAGPPAGERDPFAERGIEGAFVLLDPSTDALMPLRQPIAVELLPLRVPGITARFGCGTTSSRASTQ